MKRNEKKKEIIKKKSIFKRLGLKTPKGLLETLHEKKVSKLDLLEKRIGDLEFDFKQSERTIYDQGRIIHILREKVDYLKLQQQYLQDAIKEHKKDTENKLQKEQEQIRLQKQAQEVLWGRRPLI